MGNKVCSDCTVTSLLVVNNSEPVPEKATFYPGYKNKISRKEYMRNHSYIHASN